jgi:succinate dehydrogenase/fumarate reductase flavoprotein subunit
MADKVGPLRSGQAIGEALDRLRELRHDVLPTLGVHDVGAFNMEWQDWLDLRNMLDTAEVVALAALERRESRGAHVRTDEPETDPNATANLVARRAGDSLELRWERVVIAAEVLAP